MGEQSNEDLTPSQQTIVALIEKHRQAELEKRSVDETLATMVADPYIFFVATLVGGDDQKGVRAFYTTMLRQLPEDMEWIPVSRTVGNDKIILEAVLKFTHSVKMDWLLPGVSATAKNVEIPMVIIFNFRDGKIASERIYWDQASTLVQLGLMQPKTFPIVGSESPHKLLQLTRKDC